MRKLVLKMSISADGYVCGPNGEVDWLFRTSNPSASAWVVKTLGEAGLHIMGSRTFHDMASYWPTSADPMAGPMNDIPKVVFSKKGLLGAANSSLATQALKDATQSDNQQGREKAALSGNASTWVNVPVERDLVAGVKRLKQEEGNFILAHGGASFAQDLVKHGLIDEYRLVIHPVALGNGLSLFGQTPAHLYLNLKSSVVLDGGILATVYTPGE